MNAFCTSTQLLWRPRTRSLFAINVTKPSQTPTQRRTSPRATLTSESTNQAGIGYEGIDQESYRGEILCNRALNMANIKAVGFDMDYTLAVYNAEKFETLSARGALKNLVEEMGYPKELLTIKYDHSFFIRGLVIDKKRGNILKLDRHKYCKHALHGFRPIYKEERAKLYDSVTTCGKGFVEPDYSVLDTIFSLPDAYIFAAVVDYKDKNPKSVTKEYVEIYNDVRKAVDICHKDGYIKNRVIENPSSFIERDPRMITMLKRFRASGRKVFLLTNSLYDYTDAVMKYVYGGDDCTEEESAKWTDLFDVIIAGSCKPAFMLDPRRELYRVDPSSYTLTNTEGVYKETPEEFLSRGKTFQGGNYTHLHELLNIQSGTQVLYVGDHMFSDILRSKRTLNWRTMLIVPELEHEINVLMADETVACERRISELRLRRDQLDEVVDGLHCRIFDGEVGLTKQLNEAIEERSKIRDCILEEDDRYYRRFHPIWGSLLKTGQQNSRFAEQVQGYACLYSSSVGNLALLSPEMYYRAMPDLMVHDRLSSNPIHGILQRRMA